MTTHVHSLAVRRLQNGCMLGSEDQAATSITTTRPIRAMPYVLTSVLPFRRLD